MQMVDVSWVVYWVTFWRSGGNAESIACWQSLDAVRFFVFSPRVLDDLSLGD